MFDNEKTFSKNFENLGVELLITQNFLIKAKCQYCVLLRFILTRSALFSAIQRQILDPLPKRFINNFINI